MEIIRRKILIEDLITRESGPDYGRIVKEHIYLDVYLTQTIDNIGLYTDIPFEESINRVIDKNKIINGYRSNYDIRSWYKSGGRITTTTNSKLNDLKGYKEAERFKLNFDIDKGNYITYRGDEISGVSRIIEKDDEVIKYVIDAKNDNNLGTENQTTGLYYIDDNGTTVTYTSQGINETNSSLSAISKKEFLMGIISNPQIKNDVFINRGQTSVTEHHLRLSEIESLEHLVNYGNGYYNVTI